MAAARSKTKHSGSRSRSNGNHRSENSHAPEAHGAKDHLESLAETAQKGGSTVVEEARGNGLAQGALAAAAGTAVAALVGRAILRGRIRQKKHLGISMPRKGMDMRTVGKQIGNMAGRLEKAGADLSEAGGRAKRATQVLTER
jgi:hypothetical protein